MGKVRFSCFWIYMVILSSKTVLFLDHKEVISKKTSVIICIFSKKYSLLSESQFKVF